MMRAGGPGLPARFAGVVVASLALVTGGVLVSPGSASANTVRDLQWYLGALGVPEAHKVTKGRGVTVAVIDTGVNASHPDLRGQVLPGHGIGSDATPDGRRNDSPDSDHGTAMAGLIAGRGDGDMSLLGIAPEAKILPVSLGATIDALETAEAIRWAVDNGADVINMSFVSGSSPSQEEKDAVSYALDKNVVLVAAAGNRAQGDTIVRSPANIAGVIAVAGTQRDKTYHPESTHGPEVVVAAPMEKIISASSSSPNGYSVASGTSDASALISGAVALVRSRYPDLGAAEVINRVIATAEDLGRPGRDEEFGFGLVDPVAALKASVEPVGRNPLLPAGAEADPREPGAGDSGDSDDLASWIPSIAFKAPDSVADFVQLGICLVPVVGALVVGFVLVRRSRRVKGRRDVQAGGFGAGGPGRPMPPQSVANPGYPPHHGYPNQPGQAAGHQQQGPQWPSGQSPFPPAGPGEPPRG